MSIPIVGAPDRIPGGSESLFEYPEPRATCEHIPKRPKVGAYCPDCGMTDYAIERARSLSAVCQHRKVLESLPPICADCGVRVEA